MLKSGFVALVAFKFVKWFGNIVNDPQRAKQVRAAAVFAAAAPYVRLHRFVPLLTCVIYTLTFLWHIVREAKGEEVVPGGVLRVWATSDAQSSLGHCHSWVACC